MGGLLGGVRVASQDPGSAAPGLDRRCMQPAPNRRGRIASTRPSVIARAASSCELLRVRGSWRQSGGSQATAPMLATTSPEKRRGRPERLRSDRPRALLRTGACATSRRRQPDAHASCDLDVGDAICAKEARCAPGGPHGGAGRRGGAPLGGSRSPPESTTVNGEGRGTSSTGVLVGGATGRRRAARRAAASNLRKLVVLGLARHDGNWVLAPTQWALGSVLRRARHLLARGQIQRDRIFPLNSGSSVQAHPRGPDRNAMRCCPQRKGGCSHSAQALAWLWRDLVLGRGSRRECERSPHGRKVRNRDVHRGHGDDQPRGVPEGTGRGAT